MPLVQSASRQAIGDNIRREEAAKKPFRQALAIALSTQDRNRRRAAGGPAPQAPTYQTAGTNITPAGLVLVPQAGSYNLDLNSGAMTPSSMATLSNVAQRGMPIAGTIQGGPYPSNSVAPPPPPPAPPGPSPQALQAMMDAQASQDWFSQFGQGGTMAGSQRYGGAIRRAVGGMTPAMPWWTKSEARGEEHVPAGLIHGITGGRADKVAMNLAPNSHVIPSDVVSGWGQGNTASGAANLEHAFHTGPFGVSMPKPPSRGPSFRAPPAPRLARGGVPSERGGIHTMVSDGELIVPPADVHRIGDGDHDRGHDWLDRFIVHSRKHIVAQTKKLKGPVRD
ncbi:MAG TPA: hypothetical protein VH024_17525 [Candidatus Angelobacter sp.]|jgi:hypothetical protein|nr:hypothetical protein [Candidatus Angelobacter sp.]